MIPGSANPLLLKSAAAAGGLQIERSLRFNSADSAHLSRTPAVAGNRTTWTWSGWVKRSAISSASTQVIFDAFSGNGGNYFLFQFTPADVIQIYLGPSVGELVTTSVYRDASAWYHFVLAYDTTQATPANRIRLYVNNVEVTTFSTATYPSQNNANNYVNSTVTHHIGTFNAIGDYFNGYLTNIHFIDGQALTPSSFTETDATTGQLIPKTYSGSYGTNGFNLLFADNSAATASTLGKDTSPNGNNWTPNNLSVTAGTGNDSLVDSPTNYGTDTGVGGEVRGNYATFSPLALGSYASLTNGNLDITGNTATNSGGSLSTIGFASGKYYYEYVANSTGSVYGGVVTYYSNDPSTLIDEGNVFGRISANKGIGIRGLGNVQGNAAEQQSIAAFTYSAGEVIGVAIDADNGAVYFSKSGSFLNSGVPTSGANKTGSFHNWTPSSSRICYPAVTAYNTSGGASANFGQRAFAYTAPSGFKALCTQNLPAPLVTKSNTVFDVITYTGTGSSLTLPNGSSTPTSIAFTPDFVWLKGRSGATDHAIYDSVRDVQKDLVSNSTAAETTQTTGLTAFGTNTFTVGSLAKLNTTSATYVGWAWDAGTGSPVSNPDGSITSQVRANATAGFSVVTASPTSAGNTIGHGLGVKPALIIVKRRDASTQWAVYHSTLGANKYLYFNLTNAAETGPFFWNNVEPTSSVFTVGTDGIVFGSSVYYCFAPVVGHNSFGSYTGNGSTDGSFVYTGFRPRWVMIKSTSISGEWGVWDTARNTFNVTDSRIRANSSNAELTQAAVAIDVLSNGFKLKNNDSDSNQSSATYIYAAFAEAPFNYSRAR